MATTNAGYARERSERGYRARQLALLAGLLPALLLIVAWSWAAQPEAGDAQPSPPDVQPATTGAQPVPSPAAKPAASPATKPGASPAAKPAAAPAAPQADPGWNWITQYVSLTTLLVSLAAALALVSFVGWYRSNRAEATPDAEHLAEMRRFVEEDFARYIASGLPLDGDGAPPSVAADPGWRKLFVHHLQLHNELYRFSTKSALALYTAHVDDAVRRALDARRATVARPERDGEELVPPVRAS